MNLDQFYNRTYNSKTYNCAHFVVEVWVHITGDNIAHILKGFLLPPENRYVDSKLFKHFKKLNEPKSPCIVLMQRPKTPPHVGVYFKGRVFQITEQCVDYQPVDVATQGFNKVGYYSC